MAKKRLTVQEVWNINDDAARKGAGLAPAGVIELCESHEVYRGFAQRFIDIYSGRVATLPDGESTGLNANDPANQQVLFFALFLEIVGPIAPKV